MIQKLLLIIGFLTMSVSIGFGQTGSLEGTVSDSESGEVLPGSNIYIIELNRGTSADAEGQFSFSNVTAGEYNIRVSFVGYISQEYEVEISEGRNVVDFTISPSRLFLDELVVTGYGEVERKRYTGSIAQVSSRDIENIPITSIEESLQGRVSGLNISSSSGTPGATQQLRIRGISSITAGNAPLFVIDGVPVVSGSNQATGYTSPLGVMSNLSPSDIESINVLKDAVATAPYGARGANGVVVIETKKGRSGDVTYSATSQIGFSNRAVSGPEMINAEQWDELYRVAWANHPATDVTPDEVTSPWDGVTSTDWGDVVTNNNAPQREFGLSAQGGNETTRFFASGNYHNKHGQAIGVELDRISGRLNVSHDFDERITIDNNLTMSYVRQNGSLEGSAYFANPVASQFFNVPIDPVYNEDGTYNINNLSNNHYHPLYIQDNNITRKENYRLLNNTRIHANILDNLSFSTNFNIDFLLSEEKLYDNPIHGGGAPVGGSVYDIDHRNFNYVWRNTLRYIWQPHQDHIIDLRGVSESQRNYFRSLGASGIGVASDGLYNLSTTSEPNFLFGGTTDWAVQSFTSLANYSYQDKLILDGSLRREGSSLFSESERWGNFWSAGVAYILTEETFFQNIEWLDLLKIRGSYGITGNASIDENQYQATVGFSSYNGQPSIVPSSLGNSRLSWEKQESFDLSLEYAVFDRVDGSVTYFRKNGYDLLFNVPLTRTSGHSSQTQNLGKLYNEGLEIDIQTRVLDLNNFSWSLGGNFTTLKNEVTELPRDPNGNAREITTATRYRAVEGYEVDAWFMREWAGVDPANGNPLWYTDVLDSDGNSTGERTTTSDYNQATPYYQGANALPTAYGGFNTRIDLYGFYVSANLSYSLGYKVYDTWATYMMHDGAFQMYGQYARQMDYWKEPGDQALNPRPVWGGNNNSNQTSTRRLYDGDHLRLQSLNIGYNIPSTYLSNLGLRSATVYFVGHNLWTHVFDDTLEFDPDVPASGFLDYFGAPVKSTTFGIKIDF